VRGLTLLDAVTLIALGAIAAIVAVPRSRVRSLMENEDRVVADLRVLAERIVADQRTGRRDADGDGVGEFAPLGEVLGDLAPAAQRAEPDGVWVLHGYRFASMTPGPRRLPVLAGAEGASADHAEAAWAVLAWPDEPGVTGMRAYAATPHGILQHQIDGYPYDAGPPPLEWTMVVLDGPRARRAGPYSGDDWRAPVRDLRR
jgi:hypothetical protein